MSSPTSTPTAGSDRRLATIALAGDTMLGRLVGLRLRSMPFSAVVAGISYALGLPYLGPWITLIGYFALLFAVNRTADSAAGLFWVFALTGFMGYTLGPILSFYVKAIPDGHTVVMSAFGITAVAFTALSAYAIRSGRRFSAIGGFLFVGILTAFLLGLAAIAFSMPGLALAVSGMFVLLMAGLILYQTGEIVNGGETNYIHATVTLYVSIYNMFTSLLHLLGVAADD